jgi:hypothetical protein
LVNAVKGLLVGAVTELVHAVKELWVGTVKGLWVDVQLCSQMARLSDDVLVSIVQGMLVAQ